jgi:putative FmdB family regulatory protein
LAKRLERKEGERMPSYDYRCSKCKKKFTAILSIGEHDAGKVKCPKCGENQVQQLITAFLVKTSKKS